MLIGLCLAAIVAVGVVSCAEPPRDRIGKARAALADVRDAVKAGTWSPAEMENAAASMGAAEKELSTQERRFAMNRDYTKATELFRRAAEDLDMARESAIEARAEAERSAREAMEAVDLAIGHAQATLMVAPVPRDDGASAERLEMELARAEGRLVEVRRLIDAEQFKQAAALADEILDQVSSLIRTASRAARK
jgi:phosphatidylserine/phosphatidylglycerophosphate/cardiolipin synthase-like enzyme